MEISELAEAFSSCAYEDIIDECADVANVAMFIAENTRAIYED